MTSTLAFVAILLCVYCVKGDSQGNNVTTHPSASPSLLSTAQPEPIISSSPTPAVANSNDGEKGEVSLQPTTVPSRSPSAQSSSIVITSAPTASSHVGDDNLINISPQNKSHIIDFVENSEEDESPTDALTLALYMLGSVLAVLGVIVLVSYGKR